jgi:hypothetical protein
MRETQDASGRRRDRRLSRRAAKGGRWVVALAGLIGAAAAPARCAVTPVAADAGSRQPAVALTSTFIQASGMHQASQATADAMSSTSDPTAGTVPISLIIPVSGYFTFTVIPGLVPLTARDSAPYATGLMQGITLTDTRNYLPGWSVTGQASNLTAGRQPLAASQLGWVPTGTVKGGGTLGPPVTPGDPGLGSPAILASALPGSGFGTDTLGAMLLLQIPPGAAGETYTGTLTITVMASGL